MPRAEHRNILSCSQQRLGERDSAAEICEGREASANGDGEFSSLVTPNLSFCGSPLDNVELLFCMNFSPTGE